MNSRIRLSFVISLTFITIYYDYAHCQDLTIPTSDDGILNSISDKLPMPYTESELAPVPEGEILGLRFRDINSAKLALQKSLLLATAEDQTSASYTNAQAALQKIETVIAGKQQVQLFSLIDNIIVLDNAADAEESSLFVSSAASAVDLLKMCMIYEIATYINVNHAGMPADVFALLVRAFTEGSFVKDGDWEDELIPITGVEMMILDAQTFLTQIQAQPWQNAERFIGGATSEAAFSQYMNAGSGTPILKSKYAINKVTIDTKWNELVQWVAQQRVANQ